MTRAIITAQGKGSRWSSDRRDNIELPSINKQLLPLGDETVISRTIRQLQERGVSDIWLIGDPGVFGWIERVGHYTLREPAGSIIQGIISLRHLWMEEKDVLFVLGDVIFSNATMDVIVQHKQSSLFGRTGANDVTGKAAKEIFAMRVVGNKDHSSKLYGKLILLNSHTSMPGNLKLWDLYHQIQEVGFMGFVEVVGEYTDDVDSPEEYEQFFSKLEECVAEDDK